MVQIDRKRILGIQRWQEWFTGRLSPEGIVRVGTPASEGDYVLWKVDFRDGLESRISVTGDALLLEAEEFDQAIARMEANHWIEMLHEARPSGIRIRRDGGIEEIG